MARWLIAFGTHEALSCLFPVMIFGTLAVTKVVSVPSVARYDLILLVCLGVQAAMYFGGLETRDELKVIAVFHVIGLALELFKTSQGSWSYPEDAWSKVGGVPLYSGFMYASVASYLCQAWRRLHVRLQGWPRLVWTGSLGVAIYLNFFTHHYAADLRWLLIPLIFVVFWRTWVSYVALGVRYRMPLTVAFLLIAFFVWIAENISTFFSAWQYPYQQDNWQMVHLAKISSWFMLVIISFIGVAHLKHVKAGLQRHEALSAIFREEILAPTVDLNGEAPDEPPGPR